jgi:hypothetical protein
MEVTISCSHRTRDGHDHSITLYLRGPHPGETMIYQESLLIPMPIQATIIPEEKPVDVGVAMYEEYLAHEKELAAFGAAGM